MSPQTSPSVPPTIVERFDPFSAEYLTDPYPTLREMRQTTRAFHSSALDHWVVTNYADVRHILKTTSSFSALNSLQPLAELCPHAASLLKQGGYAVTPALTNLDPPGHARQHRLVNAAFTHGDALSREETTSIMLQMLFAGHETTTKLMANSFRRLLEDRASWEAICRDPSLIPNAIEEVLRFDGSVIAWRHKTKEPVEIGEARLPKDAKLLLLISSANRDPAVFPDPDRFDIRRPNARDHLSFGVGVHNCLGAPLARLEARIVLEEASERLPSLRLAENAEFKFPPSISMRGPLSLPVAW
jgi:cytochrome P450